MPLHRVAILAVVQGFTEFLPISSSAHLALAPWLFGWKDQGLAFDIALHLGTLSAVLIYFFRNWVQVIAQGFGIGCRNDPEIARNPKLLWLLAIASVPVGVFGFLFKEEAETTWRNPYLIGSMLVAVGVLMWVAERISSRRKGIGDVSLADSLIIGAAQAVAIIPGTSRSGITISAALARHINRPAAAQFSFLLSTPALAGAAAKAFWDLMKHGGVPADMRAPFAIGILLSALSGCLVIAFFLRFLRTHTLRFFIYYRIIFGIIVIALATFFRQPAG